VRNARARVSRDVAQAFLDEPKYVIDYRTWNDGPIGCVQVDLRAPPRHAIWPSFPVR
jgi:hypothetical protein